MGYNDLYKRFRVDVNGQVAAVFDTREEAVQYLRRFWWEHIGTIWDNEEREYIYTEVII